MPDICMCHGGICPLKDKCYRYRVKPNTYRQSYFVNPPYKDGNCNHFVEIRKEDERDLRKESDRMDFDIKDCLS